MQFCKRRAILFRDAGTDRPAVCITILNQITQKGILVMRDFIIFTDGDVDVPKPYDADVVVLPQYYYFDPDMVYGDEQVLSREEFFERLRTQRAYTSGVNPGLVRNRFEEALKADKDILCITVSSGLSGSYNTICAVAKELNELYPKAVIKVIDSLNVTLAAGFLCVDAIELRKQEKSIEETAAVIERRVNLLDIYFVVDDFKYLVQGGRVSPAVGKIGDVLNIKPILTMREGRIVAYKKMRGLPAAMREIHAISESRKTARIGNIYVGNKEMYEKCSSFVAGNYEATLNLIIASHVGPDTGGIALEWAE